MVPKWLLIAAASTLALGMAGASGMYGGYEIANARYARQKNEDLRAHIRVIEAKDEALRESQARGAEIADRFEAALRNMQIINRTFNTEIQREVEKIIYTDCKVPDSGADLLQRRVDGANLRLLGREVGQ